jgi:hypothetical protein
METSKAIQAIEDKLNNLSILANLLTNSAVYEQLGKML